MISLSASANRPSSRVHLDGASSDPVIASAEYTEFYAQNVRTMPAEQAGEVSYGAARSALVPTVWPVVVMTLMPGTLGVIWAAWGTVQLLQGMSVCLAVLQP